jgi:dolichol-phosphate mannosyltransferase
VRRDKLQGQSIVVIPTYNEKGNLPSLVKDIFKFLPEAKIIVVDDNSPDGTGILADQLAGKYQNLVVIHRQKKAGRGSAVLAGFEQALKEKAVEYIFEMDADFSHDPKDLPRLLSKVKEGSDVVIGSRYLPQSKIINWSFKRRIFSKLANFYAKLFLKIPVCDYTNGFRCYKRLVLESLDFNEIGEKGYGVLSEIAFLLHKKGFKFGEIPIVFVNRQKGQSNLSFSEIRRAFLLIWRLFFRR